MPNWKFVFDTETTGLPDRISQNIYFDYKDIEKYNKSRLVSIAWVLFDIDEPYKPHVNEYIIKPNGFIIYNSHFHGIDQIKAEKEGWTIGQLSKILKEIFKSHPINTIIGHNLLFDLHILASELYRAGEKDLVSDIMTFDRYCTMEETRDKLKLTPQFGGRWKPPRLDELHRHLFGQPVQNPHQSSADSWATYLCYVELMK